MVFSFCYLGRTLRATDDDWTEVVGNIWKARWTWEHLLRILGWEGDDTWNSGRFYLEVVQATILFGSEKWFATPILQRTWGSSTTE